MPAPIKTRRYRLTSTGYSSVKYGNCEVCKTPTSEVWHSVEERAYAQSWTVEGCHNLFGHKSCLEERQAS